MIQQPNRNQQNHIPPRQIIQQHSTTQHAGMLTMFFGHMLKTKIKTKAFGLFIVSILFAIVIFFFSVTGEVQFVGGLKNSGVIMHFSSYFVLSFLIAMYLKEKHTRFGKGWGHFISGIVRFKEENLVHIILKAAIIAGSYGVFIEVVQYYIPYRTFDVVDMLVNFTGAFLIFAILPFLIRHD